MIEILHYLIRTLDYGDSGRCLVRVLRLVLEILHYPYNKEYARIPMV